MAGDSAFFWIFALLMLAGGGNWGFGGNAGNYVRQEDLTNQLNSQTTQRLIGEQTTQILQQNNTNLVNAIQGFNSIGLQITNQTNVLSAQIAALSAQMNDCCCSIKTQMLENRLADTQAQLVTAQGIISNQKQSEYILGQLGKYVPTTSAGA